jgi:catechol 2,3-dioxygenase-like lactoylglutathione lyase family enzyme
MHTTGAMPCHTLALVQQLFGNGFKSWIVGELDKVRADRSQGLSMSCASSMRGCPWLAWQMYDIGNWSRQMSGVQIEQKSYEMPPREGISIAHFLTVADIERSARYYEKVFGARILSLGDGNAPAYLQLANIWMILNVGGGPTPDKPTVTLSVPDPNHINSFMNFRVADIQACYELWKSRGAKFITEPIPKYGETRCYIRDPDGYIIEVGQSTDLTYG